MDTLSASKSSLPVSYWNFSSIPLIVDQLINQDLSSVDSALSETHSPEFVPDQSLTLKKVNLVPSKVHLVFSVESRSHPSQVLFVSYDSPGSEVNPPVSMIQEGDPLIPVTTVPESDPPSLIPIV